VSDSTGSWQPDPNGRHQYRYWDGSQWTDQVADDGVTAVDPPDPGAPPPADAAAPVAESPAEPAPAEPTATDPTPPAEPTPPSDPTPTEPTSSTWGAPPTDPGATTAMPVAGGTPPPGDVPPTGTPPPGEPPKKKGSNTPALIIGGVLLLVLLGAGAWLIFGGDDEDDAREELIASVMEDGTSRDQAECMVDFMSDEIGIDRLQELEDDADPTTEEVSTAFAAAVECGVEEASDDTTDDSDDTTDDTTDDGLSGDIAGSDALLDLFIEGVMSESDLTEEQARCFSEEFLNGDVDLTELMEDPEAMATDPEVMGLFLDIFETCEIDMGAMGGGTDSFGSGESYGDDPELDALWDACEEGDGEACDDLFFQSPIGSEYEEYGTTCGNRFPDGGQLCALEDLE
jgi:hypothetical protein